MLGNETTNKKRADLIGFSARDSGGQEMMWCIERLRGGRGRKRV